MLDGCVAGAGKQFEALSTHSIVWIALPIRCAGYTLPGHADIVDQCIPVRGVVQSFRLRLEHTFKLIQMYSRLGVGGGICFLTQAWCGQRFKDEPLGIVQLLLQQTVMYNEMNVKISWSWLFHVGSHLMSGVGSCARICSSALCVAVGVSCFILHIIKSISCCCESPCNSCGSGTSLFVCATGRLSIFSFFTMGVPGQSCCFVQLSFMGEYVSMGVGSGGVLPMVNRLRGELRSIMPLVSCKFFVGVRWKGLRIGLPLTPPLTLSGEKVVVKRRRPRCRMISSSGEGRGEKLKSCACATFRSLSTRSPRPPPLLGVLAVAAGVGSSGVRRLAFVGVFATRSASRRSGISASAMRVCIVGVVVDILFAWVVVKYAMRKWAGVVMQRANELLLYLLWLCFWLRPFTSLVARLFLFCLVLFAKIAPIHMAITCRATENSQSCRHTDN